MDTLKVKKAWEVALAPVKNLPMTAIMMYMSGNSLQIFSIMMVFMAFKNPLMGLTAVNQAFERFESETNKAKMLQVKLAYVAMQFVALALAVWKVNSMGLLPYVYIQSFGHKRNANAEVGQRGQIGWLGKLEERLWSPRSPLYRRLNDIQYHITANQFSIPILVYASLYTAIPDHATASHDFIRPNTIVFAARSYPIRVSGRHFYFAYCIVRLISHIVVVPTLQWVMYKCIDRHAERTQPSLLSFFPPGPRTIHIDHVPLILSLFGRKAIRLMWIIYDARFWPGGAVPLGLVIGWVGNFLGHLGLLLHRCRSSFGGGLIRLCLGKSQPLIEELLNGLTHLLVHCSDGDRLLIFVKNRMFDLRSLTMVSG